MQSPLQPLVVLAVYSLTIFLGPKLMKNRQAFELKAFLHVYNLVQVLVSFYTFYEVCRVVAHSRFHPCHSSFLRRFWQRQSSAATAWCVSLSTTHPAASEYALHVCPVCRVYKVSR
jgi:hypothetical protein